MLTFSDTNSPLGRRDFLRVGGLSLGGLTLADLIARGGTSLSSAAGRPVTDKAVIFLFLHGGPSQYETFDPKPDAPKEIRCANGDIPTALPGITFDSHYPKLAKLADRLAIVRSYVPGDAGHNIKPVMCPETFGGSLGSAYASAAGGNHPLTGMPTNVMLFPQAVEPKAQPGVMGFGNFLATGVFGPATAPFQPGTGSLQKDMTLRLSLNQLDDRKALLARLDRVKATVDSGGIAADSAREKALSLLVGGVSEAFDLSKEDTATVARYDTEPLVRVDAINKKWNNHKNYLDNARTLGKLLLLARRLCERGAGFVTVTTSFVWDMHADSNNAPVTEGMNYMGPPLDHALSAFLEDVKARGLEDKILLVCCGEMGRTPRINKGVGRDHWGNLGPLLLAGGGLKMGQVIGRSSANGGDPNSDPVRIKNLVSTVVHTAFDVGRLRVTRGVSRELLAMADAEPIPGLHG